jgi:hypothetical protein
LKEAQKDLLHPVSIQIVSLQTISRKI